MTAGVWKRWDGSQWVEEAIVDGSAAYTPLVKSQAALGLDNWISWETFNRANGSLGTSDSGFAWSSLSGTWAISSNRATQSSGTATAKVAVHDPGAGADGSTTVRCTHHDGSLGRGYGVVFRAIDNTNYLYADVFEAAFRLSKLDGGSFTNFAQATALTIEPGQPVIIAVTYHSDRIDAVLSSLSGRQIGALAHTLSAGDQTKYGAATKVGMVNFAATTVTYDNMIVRAS